jgi:hypothetical protein
MDVLFNLFFLELFGEDFQHHKPIESEQLPRAIQKILSLCKVKIDKYARYNC